MTCFECPTQYSFETECNREGYIRYRWGILLVYLSEPHKKIDIDDNELILWAKLNSSLHGTLEEEILINILKSINMELKEKNE